jgi:hypothetical protein
MLVLAFTLMLVPALHLDAGLGLYLNVGSGPFTLMRPGLHLEFGRGLLFGVSPGLHIDVGPGRTYIFVLALIFWVILTLTLMLVLFSH